MNIELYGQYKTRDGHDVRIIAVDRKKLYFPVIGLIDENGVERIETYTADGMSVGNHGPRPSDIVIPQPRVSLSQVLSLITDPQLRHEISNLETIHV